MNEKDMVRMASAIAKKLMKDITPQIDEKFQAFEARATKVSQDGDNIVSELINNIKNMSLQVDELKQTINELQSAPKKRKSVKQDSDSDGEKKKRQPSGYIRFNTAIRNKLKEIDGAPTLKISQLSTIWRSQSEEVKTNWNEYAKNFNEDSEDTAEEPTIDDVMNLIENSGIELESTDAEVKPNEIDPIDAVGTKDSPFYKMADLRTELERRNLDGGGRKKDKIERLKAAMRAERDTGDSSSSEESDENGELD